MTILEWVDSANLSRTKKNLSRDFSDAGKFIALIFLNKIIYSNNFIIQYSVLLAELLKVHVPHLVELHNYISSSNTKQKRANWLLLNKKVLNKIGYDLSDEELDNLVNAKSNYIESLLKSVYVLVRKFYKSYFLNSFFS